MTFYDNAFEAAPALVKRGVSDRQSHLRRETEDFLRALTYQYEARQAELWQRDYSSVEAYLASVEPNRERWLQAVGEFGPPRPDFEPQLEPFCEDDEMVAQWITLQVLDGLCARAVIAWPKHADGPLPLCLCQHGIGSSPERVFGFDDDSEIYHSYGQRLVRDGFAVLAPMHITEGPPRARYTRLCLMLGKTLWGLEIFKIKCLLDWLDTVEQVDCERMGMWGISLGGSYTSFTLPLEPRLKCGIICAWFNDRLKKMIIDDPRYSCFLSTKEEHIFVPGWLREFCDSDLVSLICPRPVLIQCGKGDGISWWPFVVEEYERTREHYAQLDLAERCVLDLHEGGHEIRYETGVAFLRQWLG